MRRLLFVLALAGLASAQEPGDRFRHAYDVRFLTAEVRDFRGPDIISPYDSSGIATEDAGSSGSGVTGEFLTGAIVANFDEDSWSDARNSISYADGVLEVTQTRENHKRIAAYLEMLRRRFARRLVVEAEVLLLAPAAFDAADAGPGLLTAAQDKALRDAAADPARGQLVTTLRTVGMNGQRVFAADTRTRTYVRDFDIEIAQEAVVADPISGELRTGAVLDVRPVLSPDAAAVLMETRFMMARLRGLADFDLGSKPLGKLQLPTRDLLQAKCSLVCPLGRTVLLCAGSVAAADRGWVAAVLLRPTLAGDLAADETASTEKRQMRMFDVSTLTATVPDFPAPSMDLAVGQEDGGPTTAFVLPVDEGMGIELPDLIELVRENVAQESWSNSRNRIFETGSALSVIQTPDALDQIGKFLEAAAPQRARMIGVEAVVASLDEANWTAGGAALTGAAPHPAAVKALLDAARAGDGARIAATARGVGMDEQRFHVWAGSETAYVQDSDVEIATRSCATDPVIGTLLGGCSLDVRATRAGDGARLLLELRPSYVAAADPETFDTKAANGGRLHKVRAAAFSVRNQTFVGDGTWTVAGVSSHTSGGRREVFVMLVRGRSMEAK